MHGSRIASLPTQSPHRPSHGSVIASRIAPVTRNSSHWRRFALSITRAGANLARATVATAIPENRRPVRDAYIAAAIRQSMLPATNS